MNSTMTVLKIMPGRKPEKITIPHTLDAMQYLVCGSIQAIYPYEDNVALVCNEEGKLLGMEPNRAVYDEETGDIIIKLVNRTESDRVVAIDLGETEVEAVADVAQVAGDSLGNDNYLGAKEACIMEEFTVEGFSSKFNYTIPQYSATVIRLHTK